jgi:hypothetical protein
MTASHRNQWASIHHDHDLVTEYTAKSISCWAATAAHRLLHYSLNTGMHFLLPLGDKIAFYIMIDSEEPGRSLT